MLQIKYRQDFRRNQRPRDLDEKTATRPILSFLFATARIGLPPSAVL
jgi:hypothetical protein